MQPLNTMWTMTVTKPFNLQKVRFFTGGENRKQAFQNYEVLHETHWRVDFSISKCYIVNGNHAVKACQSLQIAEATMKSKRQLSTDESVCDGCVVIQR